jgi:hypothetical protein
VPRRRVEDRDLLDPLPVDQPSQFSIDLARREVLRVELRAITVDFGDVRDLVVELDKAARVEQDLLRYLVHTITAPS